MLRGGKGPGLLEQLEKDRLADILGIVGVFMGDVLMMLVDPRITLTGKEAAR